MSKKRTFLSLDAHYTRALYDAGLCDAEIAKKCGVGVTTIREWRASENLPFNPTKKAAVSRVKPKDRATECKGCIFWRSATGGQGEIHFCNHLLDTGKRRAVEEGVCRSRQLPEKRRRK